MYILTLAIYMHLFVYESVILYSRALLSNKALRVAGSRVTPAHLLGKNERQLLR